MRRVPSPVRFPFQDVNPRRHQFNALDPDIINAVMVREIEMNAIGSRIGAIPDGTLLIIKSNSEGSRGFASVLGTTAVARQDIDDIGRVTGDVLADREDGPMR